MKPNYDSATGTQIAKKEITQKCSTTQMNRQKKELVNLKTIIETVKSEKYQFFRNKVTYVIN